MNCLEAWGAVLSGHSSQLYMTEVIGLKPMLMWSWNAVYFRAPLSATGIG